MSKKPVTVPMSSPDLTPAEREAVMAVMQTPILSMGPQIEAFEAAFRAFTGAQYAIGVNSGTAGLHLCVRAAGIGPGDLVITSPFSFVASTNVLLFENAAPIYVDVDPVTGNMQPEQVRQALADLFSGEKERVQRWLPRRLRRGWKTAAQRVKAILAVDVFGQPADYDTLRELADQYHLALIEDSCEALGAEYKGRKAGMLADYGVFAFYPNKQMTTGEGGIIVTNKTQDAQFMNALRNQGRAPGDTWLSHTYLGYNYRMNELNAALGVAQMKRLEELLAKRDQVAAWYGERLAEIPGVEAPRVAADTTRVSWFVYVIRLENEAARDRVAQRLAESGVPVRPYFLPIHLQPYMVARFGFHPGDYPVTENLGQRGLALPFSGVMTEAQVDTVCRALAAAMLA
ncbi:MAG TPA: DegT/DnrJ/EryC1/StrS family aminotransferase [Anaerolineaceae bacterium]|nr:DegT/DnrJ/EryC1/StrS family aminotransferase [Anaerolineaceae bacterium]HPN52307.1 DegT/DnrJ/EryC1/StrS family aminotransferase [Anaerolineaceae bacterium]